MNSDVMRDVMRDAIGRLHVPSATPPRIVSLVPSVTELLCDLGLASALVGRTGFCIHPAADLKSIAKVGGTKSVNLKKIRALAPSHVIVNIDENEKPTVDALAEFVPHVVVTHPLAPRDNLALYRLLGGIFNATERAETLCAHYLAAELRLHAAPRREKSILYCIWQDPWMTISQDTYIARMLAQIGWQHVVLPDAARYPQFSWSAALMASIDLVLLSSEPYSFTQVHADALERQLGKPVLLVDGEMLSWYGSRAIAGLGYLEVLAREEA